MVKGGSGLRGLSLGGIHQLIRKAFHLRQKVDMPNPQAPPDPFVDGVGAPEREVTCQNETIETRDLQTDLGLPLAEKLLTEVHGGVPCARESLDHFQSSTERRFVKSSGCHRTSEETRGLLS